MTLFVALMIGILFGTSIYLMLGRELKEICMGFFLLSHAANLVIIEAGRSPTGRVAPVLGQGHAIEQLVDPLPQALILTAIVIGFAVQGFLLTLLVVMWRRAGTLDTDELADDDAADQAAVESATTIETTGTADASVGSPNLGTTT